MSTDLHDKWDGFTPSLTLDEDEEWLAYLAEMPNVSAFGDTPEAALGELEIAWDLVKSSYREEGEDVPIAPSRKVYTGSFNIRIGKELHKKLAIKAARNTLSLNALISQLLAKTLDRENDLSSK